MDGKLEAKSQGKAAWADGPSRRGNAAVGL
jgi:hypothetical protein